MIKFIDYSKKTSPSDWVKIPNEFDWLTTCTCIRQTLVVLGRLVHYVRLHLADCPTTSECIWQTGSPLPLTASGRLAHYLRMHLADWFLITTYCIWQTGSPLPLTVSGRLAHYHRLFTYTTIKTKFCMICNVLLLIITK